MVDRSSSSSQWDTTLAIPHTPSQVISQCQEENLQNTEEEHKSKEIPGFQHETSWYSKTTRDNLSQTTPKNVNYPKINH